MKRPSLREFNQIRKTSIETGVNKWAEGSCLITVGSTKVLCTASVEEQQPIWKRQQNKRVVGLVLNIQCYHAQYLFAKQEKILLKITEVPKYQDLLEDLSEVL